MVGLLDMQAAVGDYVQHWVSESHIWLYFNLIIVCFRFNLQLFKHISIGSGNCESLFSLINLDYIWMLMHKKCQWRFFLQLLGHGVR